MKKTLLSTAALVAALAVAQPVQAGEKPIGDPVEMNGMEIAAVYLQPVKMEPMVPMMDGAEVHIEADVRAIKGNTNGFGEGEWIPYLDVTYRLEKIGSDWSKVGHFMPMVASDGPHYGVNVKMGGPGKYKLTYHFNPPAWNGLYRHTDKETGVGAWWKPFDVSWEFAYAGAGKKGGY